MSTENRKGNCYAARKVKVCRSTMREAAAWVAGLLCVTTFAASNTEAADSTWNGSAGDGLFASSGNWAGGVVPGVADGTFASTDVATFSGGPPPDLGANPLPTIPVTIDANRNLRGIRFDSIDSVSFSLGGQALHFTEGSLIEVGGGVINNSTASVAINQVITAPMIVHGNNITFNNSVLQTNVGLRPQGDLSFTGGGASTLTLEGSNAQGANNGPTQVWSVLTDAPGGTTSVVKNGTGTWELRPDGAATGARPNTYSGNTVINAGVLRLSGPGAGSLNTTFIINAGGRLQCSSNNQVLGKVVLKSGGVFAASNATTFQSVKSESGPALLLDYEGALVSPTISLGFAGTTAGQGGVKLDNHGQELAAVTLGNTTTPYDLGSVLRPFDIPMGLSTNTYDFRLRGAIAGTGGLLKLGNGRMRLEPSLAGTGSPLSGTLEVRAGQLDFSASNVLVNLPTLKLTGGNVHILGDQIQSFGAVVLEKGNITSSNSLSTVIAPTVTFNVAAADTSSVNVKVADAASPTSVVKNGAGTATLGGANTYTGGTVINAGTLIVDGDANDAIIGGPNVTTVGGADIRGGKLVFDYTGGSSPAGDIVPDLAVSYASNFATGEIKSTTATSARGLGYADNGTGAFTVAYTLYGDTNLGGSVNFDDLLIVAQHYGVGASNTWSQGDSTYDGVVNFDDLLKVAQNYGLSTLADGTINVDEAMNASFSHDWALALSVVPEPTSLGLLGGLGILAGRRRR